MGLRGFSLEELYDEETPGNEEEVRRLEEEQRRQREEETRRKNASRALYLQEESAKPYEDDSAADQESPTPYSDADIADQWPTEGEREQEDYVPSFGQSWEEFISDMGDPQGIAEYRRWKAIDEAEKKAPKGALEVASNMLARTWYGAQQSPEAISQSVGNVGFLKLEAMHNLGLISDEDYEEATEDPDTYREEYKKAMEAAPWWNPVQRLLGFIATDAETHKGLEGQRRYFQDRYEDFPASLSTQKLESDQDWTKKFRDPKWYFERLGPEAIKLGVAMAASGGTAALPAGVIAGTHWGETKTAAEDFLAETRPDMNDTERMIVAEGLTGLFAFTEYATEKLFSVPAILKSMRASKGVAAVPQTGVMNRLAEFAQTTRLGRQSMKAAAIGEEALDELWGVRMLGRPTRAGYYGLRAGAAEGTEEVVSGNVQRLTEFLLGDPTSFQSGWQESVTEFIGGAAIGGPIALGPAFVNAGPEHRRGRRKAFMDEVQRVAQTPDGIALLNKISKTGQPSRRAFIEAGIDPAAVGNIQEREQMAQLFTDEALKGMAADGRRARLLDEGFQQGYQDAQLLNRAVTQLRQSPEYQEAIKDMTPEQIRAYEAQEAMLLREELRGQPQQEIVDQTADAQESALVQPIGREVTDPEYMQKRMEEKRRLGKTIAEAFPNLDPGMAIAAADVLQNWMTVEETAALTFTRGGKPSDSALYQIQEVVQRILQLDPQERARAGQSEAAFFGRDGVFREASREVLKPEVGAAQIRKPNQKLDDAWVSNVEQARTEAERKKKLYIEPKDPYKYGAEFDANTYDAEAVRPILNEALDDFQKFIANNEKFKQYYETEVDKEREVLLQKYPELQQDYNFWFYRMINAVASAQTELSKNTEETDMAYGGFKETGRIPIVMGMKEMEGKGGETQTKPDPEYALPRLDDAELPVVTYEDVERVISNLEPIVDRIGKKSDITVGLTDKEGNPLTTKTGKQKTKKAPAIPRKAINALLNPAKNPKKSQGFIMRGPTKAKRGKPAETYKDFLYEYFAPTFIQGMDTDAVGTSSKPLVSKLLREYLTDLQNNGGDRKLAAAAMRDRVRTAFTIFGGSSQYNKARNYETMNLLFDGSAAAQAAGIPLFKDAEGNPDVPKLVDWLNERVPWAELAAQKQALGFGDPQSDKSAILDTVWTAEGQQDMVPRTFLFGPKVGAYMLNRMADLDARNADYNTMDVWESRFWRSFAGDQLMDDAPGIASSMPRKVYMRLARDFARLYEERTGEKLKVSAGQAARWYMMKKAAAEAGYSRAGRDETIAGFTTKVMDKWMAWQLGQLQIQRENTPGAILDDLLTKPGDVGVAEDMDLELPTVTQVGEAQVIQPSIPIIEQALGGMTAEQAQEILGDPRQAQVLFQTQDGEIAGSTEMAEGAGIIIRAFEKADADTLMEELSHGLRLMALRWDVDEAQRGITDDELKQLEDWAHGEVADGPREAWTREADEKFAAGMRQYLATDKADLPFLQEVYNKVANALASIYRAVTGRRPTVDVSPEVEAIFQKLQTRERRVLAARRDVKVRDAGPEEFIAAQEGIPAEDYAFMDKKDAMYIQSVIENGGRVRLSPDGRSGYIISPDGDLQNLFVNKTRGSYEASGKVMMAEAIADGARTLDCYRGHLTDFYSNMGWTVKSFSPWNDEFAPDGWDYEKYGKPDYVEMVYEGTRDPNVVLKNYKKHGKPEDQFKTDNEVFDAVDGYEFDGGSMDLEQFMTENGLDEMSPEDVIAQLDSYDAFGTVDFDPETGQITFNPLEEADVVQVETEEDVRPEDTQEPAPGGVEVTPVPEFRRGVDRRTGEEIRQGRQEGEAQAEPDAGAQVADAYRDDTRDPAGLTDAELGRFSNDAFAAASAVGQEGRFGDQKVFLGPIRDSLGLDAQRFAALVTEANKRNQLTLSRADLVAAMDPQMVASSQIQNRMGAQFHFLQMELTEKSLPEIQAAAALPSLGQRPKRGKRRMAREYFEAEGGEPGAKVAPVLGKPVQRARKPGANHRQLVRRMASRFGVTVHPGRLEIKNAFAYYHTRNKTIRSDQREIFEMGIMSHEVAHKIDDMYGITNQDMPEKVREQLKQLDYSKKDNIKEGFAEFIRILLTRNEPDLWNTSTVHDWFEQHLRAKHPKLLDQITETRAEMAGWRNKGAVERVADVFAGDREVDFESVYTSLDGENVTISKRKLRDALTEWFIDDDKPLSRLTEQARLNYFDMLRAGDPTMTDEALQKKWLKLRRRLGHDPATLHQLLRGTKAQLAERALRNGTFSVRTGKQLSDVTIDDVFGNIEPEEQGEFAVYAFAKSALERIEVYPDYEPGASVKDLEKVVNDIEADEQKGPRYDHAALQMTKFHNGLLELMVDAGIHTRTEADRAMKKWKYYVPMQRIRAGKDGLETGSQIMGVGQLMKRLKNGSMRPVADPRDSLVKRTAAAYQLANNKMVERSIIDLVKNVPGLGHMVERVTPQWAPNDAKLGDMLTQLEDEGVLDSWWGRMIRDVHNIKVGKATDATFRRLGKNLGLTPDANGEFEPSDLLAAAEEQGVPNAQAVITTYSPIYRDDPQNRVISTVNEYGKRELYQVSQDLWNMYSSFGAPVANFANKMAQDIVSTVEENVGKNAADWTDWTLDKLSPGFAQRVFKTGATGASLAFGTKNLVMDSMFYMFKPQTDAEGNLIGLQEKLEAMGRGAGVAGQQLAYRAKEAWRGIMNDTSKGKVIDFNPTNSDVGNLYITMGGQFHTMLGDLLVSDRDVGKRFMQNESHNVFGRIGSAWQGLQDVVAATELPARVAAFEIQLRKNADAGGYKIGPKGKIIGKVPMWATLEALHSAAEATVNFKVGGRATRAAELYFPFTKAAWNANRSLYMMAKTMVENPNARAQFGMAFGGFVASVVALEVIGQLAGWDEEEERNRWEQEGYINLGPIPFRIPKPRELAFITEPIRLAVRNAIREMQGKDTTWTRDFGELIGSQMKEHLPIPGINHRSGFYGSLISAINDEDQFRGRPIESPWMKQMDVASRTDKQVWMGAKGVADSWNFVTPESWHISPKKVDFVMKNTVAGHQRYLSLLDTGTYKSLGRRAMEAGPLAHFVSFPRLGQSWHDMKDKKESIDQEIAGLNNKKWIDPTKTEAIEAEVEALKKERERITMAEGMIKEMQAIHYGGDTRLYELMTGLARWTLGKPPTDKYPNPMEMPPEELPEILRQSDAYRKLRHFD
jgi:hypothetical protein